MIQKKWILVTFLLLCWCIMTAEAQNVSLKLKNVTIKEALDAVKKQTGKSFFFSVNDVDIHQIISLDTEDLTLEEVLKQMFKNQRVTFEMKGDHIVVSTKEKKLEKKSQLLEIRGNVSDENGLPLIGVNITSKDSNGTISDINGNFQLTVPAGATLTFSYIGYNSQNVKVKNKTTINIVMIENQEMLDEVVVVGYGTQKKANLTGAVEQIDAKKLENRPVPNLGTALQGAIPGLNVNVGSGKPGQETGVGIRGYGSINGANTLVLIDGVEGDMDKLNPRDVESVSVLKDASSAAIYGARAAFGVVLITTKNGKAGKAKISYNGRYSFSKLTTETDFITTGYDNVFINNMFSQAYDGTDRILYDEQDMAELYARRNDRVENPERPWIVTKNISGEDRYIYYGNFDWWNYLHDASSPSHDHNLNISGGNDKINYVVSANYYSKDGIYKIQNDNFDRINMRSRISAEVTKWLKITATANFFKSQYLAYGFQDGENIGDIMFSLFPSYLPQNPDGTNVMYTTTSPNGAIGTGLPAMMHYGKSKTVNDNYSFTNSYNLVFSLYKGLNLTTDYSYKKDVQAKIYRTVHVPYSNSPGIIELRTDDVCKNRLRETNAQSEYHSADAFLDYSTSIDKVHNLKGLLGINYEQYSYKYLYTTADNLISDDLNDVSLSDGEEKTLITAKGSQREWALFGAFARFNYDYKGKYLFEANARVDASSRFRRGDRSGIFPSASAGWRISEEQFFKPLDTWFSNLKLRISWGALGNQNISDCYPFMQKITVSGSGYYMNDQEVKNAILDRPTAGNLTWEKVIHQNIGLDLGFLNNRLYATADIFRRDTKGMLVDGQKLPAGYGAALPRENAANLKTTGYEITIGWNDQLKLLGSTFSYNVSASLSDAQAVITKFSNPTGLYTQYYVGKKIGEIWGLTTNGLFSTDEEAKNHPVKQDLVNMNIMNAPGSNRGLRAGDVRLVDLDGDNEITFGDYTINNPGDFRVIGNTTPRYNYNFNLGFNWYGIDVSAFFQGVGKRDWYPGQDANLFWGPFSRPYMSFIPSDFMDNVWSEDNPDGYFPRPRGYAAQGNRSLSSTYKNDRYLQDLAYCRLKNFTIGYSLPKRWLERVYVQSLRIYFSGDNLLTWTKLKSDYIDPEQCMSSDNSVYNSSARIYPYSKTFSFGIDLTF